MSVAWDGTSEDVAAARRSGLDLQRLRERAEGEPLVISNEFAEVRVAKVHTRNGVRLLVESPRTGQWVTIDPLEAEALTWQDVRTFTAMVGRPHAPLFGGEES